MDKNLEISNQFSANQNTRIPVNTRQLASLNESRVTREFAENSLHKGLTVLDFCRMQGIGQLYHLNVSQDQKPVLRNNSSSNELHSISPQLYSVLRCDFEKNIYMSKEPEFFGTLSTVNL